MEEITFKQNTTTRMTTTKAYDDINRLTSISHADGAATLASYVYDQQGRQTSVAQGSITTTMTYNNAGQLDRLFRYHDRHYLHLRLARSSDQHRQGSIITLRTYNDAWCRILGVINSGRWSK